MFLNWIEKSQWRGMSHVFGMSLTSYRQPDGSYKDYKEYFFMYTQLVFWRVERKV